MDRWMDKEDVGHSYSGILLAIKRNRFGSVAVRWMDPEPLTKWSKSEREKQISYIAHIYVI